jgi:hypothetical protein
MSTYYTLKCLHCGETCHAASASGSSGLAGHLVDSNVTLLPFLVWHAGHPLMSVSEHDGRYPAGIPDWTAANVEQMAARERIYLAPPKSKDADDYWRLEA